MKNLVSVVLIAQGGSRDLNRSLDSILGQTYKDIEVIVVYDKLVASKTIDGLIGQYGDKVKYYNKDNKGIADALNFAINKTSGKYFAWLSQGDTFFPRMIEKQVALIDDKEDVIAVSEWVQLNPNNRKIRDYTLDGIIERYPGCYLAFTSDAQFNTSAMLFPSIMLKDTRPFTESIPSSHDYILINRLVLNGAKFKVNQEPLLNYAESSVDEYLNDPRINSDYDFIRSDIVNTLTHAEVINYFGGTEEAVIYHKELLKSGHPRTAAFLIAKLIGGSFTKDGTNLATSTLLQDLSLLPSEKMATSADTIISKILERTQKRRILFSSGHWLTGGMERVMSTLFEELRSDYDIFLITPYSDTVSRIDVPDFVTHIKIDSDLFVENFDSIILSYALLFDVEVAVGFMNLFKKQLNLYSLCVGTKIKTIASNHEYYFYPYKSPVHYGVVEERLRAYVECDAIVWPNNFNAALCGLYVDNNYVIGNPNNFEVATEKHSPKDNRIICVGRFNDYVKRIDRMLECFSLVLNKVPDAKLVLVGKYDNDVPFGPDGRTTVNDLINSLAIPATSINFVGEVNNVQDLYEQAKVLMLTSSSEGFGMVLNEAACFGVPSVCNYIPGVEDIITDGENGFITEQDDTGSMASKICDILTNDTLQEKLSNSAKKKVLAYDSKHIGSKWRYLIDALLDVQDDDSRKKISSTLGYKIVDQQKFLKVLARELNEIFYMSIHERGQHKITNKALLVHSKFKRLPKRLKANIKYEGTYNTGKKIVKRSYRIARNKLVKN